MKKFILEDKIKIYNEYKNGVSIQELSKKYQMNFSNLRYMVKFIDIYGIEAYIKPNHYSNDLKEYLINRVLNKDDSTFNIALQGGLKSRTMLIDLVKKYKENGYNIVERKRGRSPIMPKKQNNLQKTETLEEENERLKKENLYLKAELEYSKKLRAVVQARKNQQQKKK